MALLKIYDDIQNENEAIGFFGDHMDVFSADRLRDFLDGDTGDSIDGRIHCRGGSVIEGYTCHDLLTHSGKKVTMTVEGICASIATVILLSAPKESRKIYPNAQVMIHEPYIPEYTLADSYTAEDLSRMALELETETNRLVDFYVLHTGADRAELLDLVKKETFLSAEEALRLGFVSEILTPTSNKGNSWKNHLKPNKMDQNQFETKLNLFEKGLNALLKKFSIKNLDGGAQNMQITDVTGAVLTIERESGDPQVGDVASPDGTFTREDGSQIVVSNGAITEIIPAVDLTAELENLRNENQRLQGELDAALAQVEGIPAQVEASVAELRTELQNKLSDLKKLSSGYKPAGRIPGTQDPAPSALGDKVAKAKEKKAEREAKRLGK